jgi:hypothetical protein
MIFMVIFELLAPYDQRIPTLFPDKNDRDHAGLGVNIEQDAVLAEESQLALGNRIGPQRFQVHGLCQGIGPELFLSGCEYEPAVLAAEPTEIVDCGFP